MMRIALIVALLASTAQSQESAEQFTVGQKQELLSAILCIDLDVQAQAKERIKTERDSARESGGGIIDMEVIHDAQEDFARAGREATRMRKQLAAIKQKALKCNLVARVYNCVNNRGDQIQSDPEHCDIQNFSRVRNLIMEVRLDEPEAIESTRLYTFTK